MRLFSAALSILLLLGALAETGNAKSPTKSKIKDLNDTVSATRILSQFARLVAGSDLASFLSSRGPFVLFVPTNSAFSKLPPGTVEALLEPQNKEMLQRIVLFHIVNGQLLTSKDLLKQKSLPSCEGHPLPVHTNRAGTQFVMKAKLLHADIRCANGLLDEIDTVLIPPGLVLPPPAPPAPVAAAPAASTNAAPDSDNDGSATNTPAAPPAETNAIPVAPSAPGQ